MYRQDGTWLSLCLDLALAARATSYEEAQRRLTLAIRERSLRACETAPHADVEGHLIPALPWRHRIVCGLVYWLAPLRRARVYRETLPFGVIA